MARGPVLCLLLLFIIISIMLYGGHGSTYTTQNIFPKIQSASLTIWRRIYAQFSTSQKLWEKVTQVLHHLLSSSTIMMLVMCVFLRFAGW